MSTIARKIWGGPLLFALLAGPAFADPPDETLRAPDATHISPLPAGLADALQLGFGSSDLDSLDAWQISLEGEQSGLDDALPLALSNTSVVDHESLVPEAAAQPPAAPLEVLQ